MRITFGSVERGATRRGKCPICGERVTRSKTFSQTVNPFNRNEHGEIRQAPEIWAALNDEAIAWIPDFRHAKCIGGAS